MSYFSKRNLPVPISIYDKACIILRIRFKPLMVQLSPLVLSGVHSAGGRDAELISGWLGTAQFGTDGHTKCFVLVHLCHKSAVLQPCSLSLSLSPSKKFLFP